MKSIILLIIGIVCLCPIIYLYIIDPLMYHFYFKKNKKRKDEYYYIIMQKTGCSYDEVTNKNPSKIVKIFGFIGFGIIVLSVVLW
jgi:hypothetical protein